MKKILIYLLLILYSCYCQTNINIHNSQPSCVKPLPPPPPQVPTCDYKYSYATSFGFNDGYFAGNYMRELWDEIVKRTPELKGHISPVPYFNTNQYFNLSENCIYDLLLLSYYKSPYRIFANSIVEIDRPKFKKTYTAAATNLPALTNNDAGSTVLCDNKFPTCKAANLCAKGNYSDIATYAIKNNVSVTIYYYGACTCSVNDVNMLSSELRNLGINVTTISYQFQEIQMVIGKLAQTAPTTRIYFALHSTFDNDNCTLFNQLPIKIYEFHTAPFGSGIPVCPTNFRLKTLLSSTISQMYEDYSICKIKAKYGFCKSYQNYLEPNPSFTCNNYPDYPLCTKINDDQT